jgi:hypothetical protein
MPQTTECAVDRYLGNDPDPVAQTSYSCEVVVLAPQVTLAPDDRRRLPTVATGAILLVTAIGLGVLGWILPTPGGSLAIPTLIVFGIGCAIGVVLWIGSVTWTPLACIAVITVTASVWTFAFSLPTAMILDSGATSQAEAALAQLASSPRGRYGIPLRPCVTEEVGSVGPVSAPYSRCAVSTPEGHVVLFTAVGHNGGVGFTDRFAATFLDECTRHLAGKWWMFTVETKGTAGGCPIGYQFHGGP